MAESDRAETSIELVQARLVQVAEEETDPPIKIETVRVFSEHEPASVQADLLVLFTAVGVVIATVGRAVFFRTVLVVVVEFPARSV